jgi:uncharacterized protein YjbI with pentapeptide repeats
VSRWDWLGLRERRWTKTDDEEVQPAKTLWDVAQLLIVPAMLAAIAIGFNASQSSRDQHHEDARLAADRTRAEDVRHEENLQRYFDRIADLMLTDHLQDPQAGATARAVARNATLAVLRTLDGRRKAQVVAFLADAKLLHMSADGKVHPVISLDGANLGGADFRGLDHISDAALGATSLRRARFDGVKLSEMSFAYANLRGASFGGTQIEESSFHHADLRGAGFDRATMTDGGVTFKSACLSGTSFAGARIAEVRFDQAEGRSPDFRGTRLGRHVTFVDALLTDVKGRAPDWGIHRRDQAARLNPCAAGFPAQR